MQTVILLHFIFFIRIGATNASMHTSYLFLLLLDIQDNNLSPTLGVKPSFLFFYFLFWVHPQSPHPQSGTYDWLSIFYKNKKPSHTFHSEGVDSGGELRTSSQKISSRSFEKTVVGCVPSGDFFILQFILLSLLLLFIYFIYISIYI